MLKLDGIGASWAELVRALLGYIVPFTILYWFIVVVYRVTFHPLAKFNGPWFAAVSYGYEFWYEVVRGAQYTQRIVELHEQYGPIIRINPDELHCNDPSFLDTVYAIGHRKRNKPKHHAIGWASASHSTFGTTDHVQHRMRRSALNKFFSRARAAKFEDHVHEKAQLLCDKFLSFRCRGAIDVAGAYISFSTDNVSQYCLGSCTGFLDQDGWEPNCKSFTETMDKMTHINRHAPWVRYVRKWIPLAYGDRAFVKPFSSSLHDFLMTTRNKTSERNDRLEAVFDSNGARNCPIYQELANSDMPMQEKTPERLKWESVGVTTAGTLTTASTLSNVTYHLLSNPQAYHKLREELLPRTPDPKNLPRWAELEELPYLNAVIHESMRLLYDTTRQRLPYETSQERLPRVAPEEDLVYEPKSGGVQQVIPRGYAIGMSAYLVHTNETLFPNPTEFVPERWLDENGCRRKGLERYLLAFSKGSRSCVGMHVAYCELYIAVAALTLRVLPSLELCSADGNVAEKGGSAAKSDIKGNMVRVCDV